MSLSFYIRAYNCRCNRLFDHSTLSLYSFLLSPLSSEIFFKNLRT